MYYDNAHQLNFKMSFIFLSLYLICECVCTILYLLHYCSYLNYMGLEKVHALRKRHLQYIQNENTHSLSILEQSGTLPSSSSPTHCTLNTFGAACGSK